LETKKINLFVFDTPNNYEKSKKFIGNVGVNLKSMHRVDGVDDFRKILGELNSDDLVFMAVHVFSTDNVNGIKLFTTSGLTSEFPNLGFIYISEGNSDEIQHLMVDSGIPSARIYKNHQILSELRDDRMKVLTKAQLLEEAAVGTGTPQFDYAVITALYQDEFEEVEKVFDFPEDETIATGNKDYRVGYLKTNRNKKIIAAFQNSTGMVEAGIIAMHMLEKFRPKYLIMSGVCGGTMDSNIGDIIIAKQIFTFQKGKVSDLTVKDGRGKPIPLELYSREQQPVDYDKLYDQNGDQVNISIEKFERERDSTVDLDTKVEDRLNMGLKRAMIRVNNAIKERAFHNSNDVTAKIEPMACSTMVINRQGYFEDTIRSVERKTAAVEMESFGVARACKFGNDGLTKPIIFKSVMDFTQKKTDVVDGFDRKKFAAATSAQFLAALFEENLI